MAAKKWVLGVFLSFLLAAFTVNLIIQDLQEVPSHLGELNGLDGKRNQLVYISTAIERLKNMVHGLVGGSGESLKPDQILLSPNLSTCHESMGKPGFPVYCCPPKRESEEPFIEFQFPNASSPLRVRRPAHLVDDEYIAKYKKALSIMKSLPFDDPRSFMRQADMHCIYCTGAYNQQHSNSLLNIHRSWLFFPWHRMMIYFHERILGNLIGDDTFALPFWNWDSPPGMVMPNMYMKLPFLDQNRQNSHLPPHLADINFDYVESGLGPEEQIATNLAFMYNQMVSGAKKSELFMGCPYKAGENGSCNGPGTIELAPHNSLHTWVGSPLNIYRENMGVFYAAARDPIFYAHHSNIDRLWEVWRGLRGYKPEIIDPLWLDSYFFFHDENKQLVRVRIRDVLDIAKLGYSYEHVDHLWLNARPKPSVAPEIARSILNMRGDHNGKSADFGPKGRTLDAIIRARVLRPKRQRSKKEREEEEEVLVVYGIDVKRDMYVKFDVYVNAVDETTLSPKAREFAGTFVNVRRGVTIVMNEGDAVLKRKSNLKLGISELLEDLEANEDETIWVSLVPRGGTGVNTTFDGIRIEFMA